VGLAISVGLLADLNENDQEGAKWLRDSLNKVNEVLRENDLPQHTEPEKLPKLMSRASTNGYPYSFLHHLRRFAAHASQNPNWKPKPFPDTEGPADDPAIDEESSRFESHLLCHSDCEGYYLPIDFPEPIFADEERIRGGMLGSSQGLIRELIAVAPYLSVKLIEGKLSDAEAARINTLVEAEGQFWIELLVWIDLFEATRLSIEHRTAVCFG
jgi:hypothetical protein